MNEQPSKSRANHPSKTSKIASSRSAGSSVRASTSRLQPVARPALLAPLQERQGECVLGRKCR